MKDIYKNNYKAVRSIVQKAYTENQTHFQTEVPLFTKFLAPGLGLAEEPGCQFTEDKSLGATRKSEMKAKKGDR